MKVVFFSGGLSSFAVAHHLKDEKPLLYFTDTLWEDEDLYRFIYEVSDKLQLPMLIHSLGVDPVELMIKQKIIFNSRIGNCSTYLKMKVAADYFKKGIVPPIEKWHNKHLYQGGEVEELYFGIGYDEFHRVGAIKKNWEPFKVKFPLVETMFDFDELLKLYDIEKPRMYKKGFTHNNCKGRCVKAGKGHFRLLFNEDRQTFDEINRIEIMLQNYVAAWHSNKNDESKSQDLEHNQKEMEKWHKSEYMHKPILKHVPNGPKPTILKNASLDDIRKQQETNAQFDLFEDIGGCGCFVDFEEDEND